MNQNQGYHQQELAMMSVPARVAARVPAVAVAVAVEVAVDQAAELEQAHTPIATHIVNLAGQQPQDDVFQAAAKHAIYSPHQGPEPVPIEPVPIETVIDFDDL